MKRLFCSLILVLGVFVAVQAQTLFIQVTNNSVTNTWRVKVADAQGQSAGFPAVGPGQSQSAVINNLEFAVQIVGVDAFNCEHNAILNGPASGSAAALCFGAGILSYNLTQIPFTTNYNLAVTVN